MILIKLLSVLMLFLVLAMGTVHAQSEVGASSVLEVYVDVRGVCDVFTDPLFFPPYDSAAGSFGTGGINVNCGDGIPYWIALDAGMNYDGLDLRYMAGPSLLGYQLYLPDGTTTPWGDMGMPFQTNNWEVWPAVGFGGYEGFPVQGEIPAGQAAPPGPYSDLVNVTVWY